MIFLINNDNTAVMSVRTNIIQYSNNVDDISFIAHRLYNELDMANFSARITYILPISNKMVSADLDLVSDDYDGLLAKDETSTTVANGTTTTTINENTFVQYKIPAGCSNFTSEGGNVRCTISWYREDLNEDGTSSKIMIRKMNEFIIPVTPGAPFDFNVDSALNDIDQKIIEANRLSKEYFDVVDDLIAKGNAVDVGFDETKKKIILKTLTSEIGLGISLEDLYTMIGEAIIGKDSDAHPNDGVIHLDEVENSESDTE